MRISDWSSDVCSSDLPLLREILHLQAPGEINVQNAFLRDVFVCMMIAPLLVRLPSIALGAMLAGVFAWCIEGWQLYLLLRPQILLFFLVGVLAFRFSLNRSEKRRVGKGCVGNV